MDLCLSSETFKRIKDFAPNGVLNLLALEKGAN